MVNKNYSNKIKYLLAWGLALSIGCVVLISIWFLTYLRSEAENKLTETVSTSASIIDKLYKLENKNNPTISHDEKIKKVILEFKDIYSESKSIDDGTKLLLGYLNNKQLVLLTVYSKNQFHAPSSIKINPVLTKLMETALQEKTTNSLNTSGNKIEKRFLKYKYIPNCKLALVARNNSSEIIQRFYIFILVAVVAYVILLVLFYFRIVLPRIKRMSTRTVQLDPIACTKKLGIWEYEVDSNTIKVSKNWLQVDSAPKELENIDYSSWKDRILPDDLDRFNTELEKYIESPKSNFEIDVKYNHPQKGLIWLRAHATATEHLASGKAKKLSGYHCEITSQKEYQEKTTDKEERLKVIFNSIEDAVISTDRDGTIDHMNQVAEFMTGWSINEVKGKNIGEILNIYGAYTKEKLPNPIQELLKKGQYSEISEPVILIDRHGVELHIASTVSPIEDPNSGITGIVISIRDVTQEFTTRKELRVYKTLIESSIQGFLMMSMKGRVKYMNNALLAMLGESIATNYFTENFQVIYSPRSQEMFDQFVLTEINKTGSWSGEMELISKNGKIISVISSFFTLKDINDQDFLRAAIITNITERKNSEETIIASEKRFRALFENSPVAYLSLNIKGEIVDVNPEFCNMTGYKQDELISHSFTEITSSEDKTTFARGFNSFLEKGEISTELSILGKDSNKIHLIVVGRVQLDKDEAIVGTHWILFDFTERKEMEENLALAKDAAESANRAKSAFLANMSHEIRTPMNAIIGFSEILLKLVSDESKIGYLNSIKSSCKTLLSLINDILDLSKIEAGRMTIKKDIIDIRGIFSELLQIFRLETELKGINLFTEVDSNVPEFIELDELRIRQVLINLVNNAIKFTKKGYIKIKASSENFGETINLNLSVEDTGIGVKESEQEKIFEAFKQSDSYDTRNYEGTGLGLAIISKIVDLFKGKIKIESKLGIGSTFTVELKNIKVHTEDIGERINVGIDPESILFYKGTILIVDDKENNLNVLKGILKQYNFEFIEANNGVQAIEIAMDKIPDLILMDLKMPEMDGYQATKFLKSNEKTRHIPVVALTASVLGFNEELLEGCKFSGYLPKPIEINKLVAELSRFLPHEIIAKQLEIAKSNDGINLIKENSELKKHLEVDVLNTWKKLQVSRTSKLEKEFALSLKKAGKLHKNNYLEDKGKSLELALETFDIEKAEAIRDELKIIFNEFIGE